MLLEMIVVLCALAGNDAGTQLTGRVTNQANQPVEGAIVVVSTCKPRIGPSTICPSCYPDCTKRALTDQNGRFTFDNLSASLQFSLAVGASGYHGAISKYIDPLITPTTDIQLKDLPSNAEASQISGHVVDSEGRPIFGAEVRSHFVFKSDGGMSALAKDVTPLTLSDQRGAFVLSVAKDVARVGLRVSAAGAAPKEVLWESRRPEPIEVRLGEGASIKGQLVHQGKPLSDVKVGLVQVNRSIGNLVTPHEISTDATGFFNFQRLPPACEYAIYTLQDQAVSGVLPVSIFKAPEDGQIADFGPLATEMPRTLTINVQTEDSSELPPHATIYVGRPQAWHGAVLQLPSDGQSKARLTLPAVGRELLTIQIRVPGYTVTGTNPTLNADLNGSYPLRSDYYSEFSVVLSRKR
jgi:uncharacterized GH25 family protein